MNIRPKKLLLKSTLILTLSLFGFSSFAGIMEVGASASYRSSRVNATNYSTSNSTTATFSYYFWEMSALELSYTQGTSRVNINDGVNPAYAIITAYEMFGADFVLTFAGKQAPLQPYIKVGMAKIVKEFFREAEGQGRQQLGDPAEGSVPSAGLGIKFKLTQTFTIKVGLDAWVSSDDDISDISSDNLDYAARAGFSWLF